MYKKLLFSFGLITLLLCLSVNTASAQNADLDDLEAAILNTLQSDSITATTSIMGEPIITTLKVFDQGAETSIAVRGVKKYFQELAQSQTGSSLPVTVGDIELVKKGADMYFRYELQLDLSAINQDDFFGALFYGIGSLVNRFSSTWIAIEVDEVQEFVNEGLEILEDLDLARSDDEFDQELEDIEAYFDRWRALENGASEEELQNMANAMVSNVALLSSRMSAGVTSYLISVDEDLIREAAQSASDITSQNSISLNFQSQSKNMVMVKVSNNLITDVISLYRSPNKPIEIAMTKFDYAPTSINKPRSATSVFGITRWAVNELYDQDLRTNKDLLNYFLMESLDSARDAGQDAALQADLSYARTGMELYYMDKDGYRNGCEDSGYLNYDNITCRDNDDSWIAYAQLSNDNYYCVDSTGFGREVNSKPSSFAMQCSS